jgi:hypothetical protein
MTDTSRIIEDAHVAWLRRARLDCVSGLQPAYRAASRFAATCSQDTMFQNAVM